MTKPYSDADEVADNDGRTWQASRHAALAGETRTEADWFLDIQDVIKRLGREPKDASDFYWHFYSGSTLPDGRITRREAIDFADQFATVIRATAASRIAQLERELKELKRGLTNNNSDFELAFLDAYLDHFRTLKTRAETAEAALTQAQAELPRFQELLVLNGLAPDDTDSLKHCLEDWQRWRKDVPKMDIQLTAAKKSVSALMEAIEPLIVNPQVSNKSSLRVTIKTELLRAAARILRAGQGEDMTEPKDGLCACLECGERVNGLVNHHCRKRKRLTAKRLVRMTQKAIGEARQKMTPKERKTADEESATLLKVSYETWVGQFETPEKS